MLMAVFTVTVLALSVIVVVIVVVVINRCLAVVLLLKTKGHSSVVPGCYVKPALLFQLSSNLVPLFLQLSQSSTNKILLQGTEMRDGTTLEI